jgi:hypothetical protein
MTEKVKAVATTARKSIGRYKDSYIFDTNKIYYGLNEYFQSICQGYSSTWRDRNTFHQPKLLGGIMIEMLNPANHITPIKAKETKI